MKLEVETKVSFNLLSRGINEFQHNMICNGTAFDQSKRFASEDVPFASPALSFNTSPSSTPRKPFAVESDR
jgi:hypothetical protein